MSLGKQTEALKHSPYKDPITICQHEDEKATKHLAEYINQKNNPSQIMF